MIIIIAVSSITNDLFEIPTQISGFVRFDNSYFSISKYPLRSCDTHQMKEDYYACRHECG
jgi:hypothetical protein